MRYITKQSTIVVLCLIIFAITAICIRVENQNGGAPNYIMGAIVRQNTVAKDIAVSSENLSRQTISILNKNKLNYNELYFRPSEQKALNNNFKSLEELEQVFKDGKPPLSVIDTPVNALLNYFSVLQQASNMPENKTGSCGSTGFGIIPYPMAYEFLSQNNRNSMDYTKYLSSFTGIGHINLIKVIPIVNEDIDKYKYFIELETLEGTDTGSTAFNYYTGEITVSENNRGFYIDSLFLTPEDFLCAAYHGWTHDAETYVEIVYGNLSGLIMKQYAPQVDENTKSIVIDGTDGEKYMFMFARLTNGTDLLINTLIKTQNNWVPVVIDTK